MEGITGRELIIYILENNLEDTVFINDGETYGFTSVDKAAADLEVGPATMETWFDIFKIKPRKIGNTRYITYLDYITLTSWKVRNLCKSKR